jgi:hypothetical protein
MSKPNGYIIYQGPSLLDGAPIVAIAITRSINKKTGDMVQTYIMRADVDPVTAARDGADVSVCGDCLQRPSEGGACYVTLMHGPSSVWRAYRRGSYPMGLPDAARASQDRMVRLGTYGDPMAVPVAVWRRLTEDAAGRTGYSHQWANPAIRETQRAGVMALTMASVESPELADMAQSIGLRTFRVRLASEPVLQGEIVCPASDEAGHRRTCDTCGACNGARETRAASVVIVVHGSKRGRFAGLRAPVNAS